MKKNILVITAPRTASTFYVKWLCKHHHLNELGEELWKVKEYNNRTLDANLYGVDYSKHGYVAKTFFDGLIFKPSEYRDIIRESQVHVLLPRQDRIDQVLSFLIPLYKNELTEHERDWENETGPVWWNVQTDVEPEKNVSREDVLKHFEDMQVPLDFVKDRAPLFVRDMWAVEQWRFYDKRITFEEVTSLSLEQDFKLFKSREDKMKYFEQPFETLEYIGSLCNFLT